MDTIQSFPTSAVRSHLLSVLEQVQVIGLLCVDKFCDSKERGGCIIITYMSLQQKLLVIITIIQYPSVCAGVKYHLTVYTKSHSRNYSDDIN